MLLFKKIVGPLLFPLPIILLILTVGLSMLWFSRKQKAGKVITTTGLLLLVLFSFRPLPHSSLRALERTYESYSPASYPPEYIRWIVVLSGGYTEDKILSPVNRLGDASLARLVEGIVLLQSYPDARLVLTGSSGLLKTETSPAAAMKEVAVQLGVDPNRIVLEEESQDTKDHAVLVRHVVGHDPFLLVTSASHMRRSVALFNKQDLNPIPVPTNHQIKDQDGVVPGTFYPSAGNLKDATTFFHETYGYLWAKIRGQI